MVRGPVLPVHSYVYVEPVWLNQRCGSPEPRDEQKSDVPVARQNVLRSSSFAEFAVGGLPRVDKRRAPALPPEKTFAGSRRHYSYLLDQNRSDLEEDLVSEPALPQKYSTLWDGKKSSNRSKVGLPRSSGQRSLVNCGASQLRADASDSDLSDKDDPSKGLMIRGNTRENLLEGSSRRHASISSTLHGDSTSSLPPITSKSKRHSKKQVVAAVQNVDEWPELPPAFSHSLSQGTSPLPVQLSAGPGSAEPAVHLDPLSPFPSGSSPRMVAGQWSPGSAGSSWRSGSLRARPNIDYNDSLLRIYPLSEWEVRPRKPRRLREDPLNESYMSSSQSADDDLFDPSDLALFNFSIDGTSPLDRVATAPAPRRRSSLACTEELKKATHPKLSMKDAARDLKVRRMSLWLREKKRRQRGSHPPKRGFVLHHSGSTPDHWRVGTAPPGSSGSVGGIGGGGGLRWLHDDGEKPGSASDRRSLIGWHGVSAEEMGQNGWSVSSLHHVVDDAGSLFSPGGDAEKVGQGSWSRASRSSVSSVGLLPRRQQQPPQQKDKDHDEQHEQSEQSEQKQQHQHQQQRQSHHPLQQQQQQQHQKKPQHHQSPQQQKQQQHQEQQEKQHQHEEHQQGGAERLTTPSSGSRRPTKQEKSGSLPSLHVGTPVEGGSVEAPEKSARGGTLRSAPLRSPQSAAGFSPKGAGTPMMITVNPVSGSSADGHWPGKSISEADAMSPMPSGSDVDSRSGSRGAASGSSAAAKRRSPHKDDGSLALPSSRAASRGTPGSKTSSTATTPSGSPFHMDSQKSSRKPTRLGSQYLDDGGDGGGDTARSRSRSKNKGSKRSNASQQHSDDTGDRPNTAASQDEDERLLALMMARQQKREMQSKEAAAAVAAAAQAAAKKRNQKEEAEDKDGEEVFKPSRSMRSLTRPTSSHQLMPPLRMVDDEGRSLEASRSFGEYTSISGSARTSAYEEGKEGSATSDRSNASSAPVSSISTLDAPPLFKQVMPKTRDAAEPDMLLPGYRRERGTASSAAHKTMRPPTADEKSSGSSTPTADLWDEAGHILYWDADDPNSLSRRFKDAIAEVWAEVARPETPDHVREAREWELILAMPDEKDNPTVNRWKKARARLPEISLQGLLRRTSSHLLDDNATANATSIHEVYSKMQVKNYIYRMEAKTKVKLNAALRSQRGGFAGPWPGRLESCKRQLRGLDAFAQSYRAEPQPINA